MRFQREFWEIEPKLRLILVDLENWGRQHGEDIMITSLIRTQSEQDALIAQDPTSDKVSLHQLGRAADIRLFEKAGLNAIVDQYVNNRFPYDLARPAMRTMGQHQGSALHWHIKTLA